ncbi:GNAT family N-acetyltransferase [Marimonas sp. MJW-29]|uniref:GNAT family N-acetyltransferase n=1 Tax=Sulfitobacter sediminis TaxID=3234186 RepID=A0ABV3RP29_9RHOB
MELAPRRHGADSPDLPALHALIHSCFAPLNARIDPPSSVASLSLERLAADAEAGEAWSLGEPPLACAILTPAPNHLYIGKIAVAPAARRSGLAQRLLALAEERARALDKPALLLQSRVELTENHALFRKAGFRETERTTHEGFDRPTSITFAKSLVPDMTKSSD